MTQSVANWLPALVGPVVFQAAGVAQPARGTINFTGITTSDSPTTDTITFSVPSFPTLGSGVATWLATPTSANLAAAMTDETGAGSLVFHNTPVLTTPKLNNPGGTFQYSFVVSAITGNISITLPLLTGNDTFVFQAFAQTLTNKTMSGASNTFSNIPASAVLTPAASALSTLSIDWSLSGVFTKTLSAGANAFTFSNAASGMVIVVRLTGAASTVSWPTVKWPGGVTPTQTASGTDVYTFVHDGTNIYGSVVQAMA